MKQKGFQVAALIVACLVAAATLSGPGRTTIMRALSAFKGIEPHGSGEKQGALASTAHSGEDLESRARGRHGWNAGVTSSVLRGAITFYDREGVTTSQANLTMYRRYPDRLRVELDRSNSVEVWGFDKTSAWKLDTPSLSEREARDIRGWLRLCPERLFLTRGSGANYREAGQRKQDFKPARPWQAQERINPPLQLQQVEVEDRIGMAPTPSHTEDRRYVTYYINVQDFTVETARWLEPDDPGRRIDDLSAAKTDVRVDFADWRAVDGMVWPFEVIHCLGGKVDYRINLTEALVNQQIADTVFQNPNLGIQTAAASEDNQLGSSSFNLSVPIFGSDGRGVGVDLALIYNSRMWTKDTNTSKIIFDYDSGWPAPGFRLNYGRVIPNYDVPTGLSGNYLLIEADGTRTPLISQGSNLYRSNDGRYLEFLAGAINRLYLPNGTIINYNLNGSKLLPVKIKDIHGNSINISYVTTCAEALRIEACTCGSGCVKPPRQAIKQISDTLGRLVTFYYYANGNLAEIHAPGYNGGGDRTLAKFYYQSLTLAYSFSLTVSGVPGGGQVDVLRRVYFPETGRGYVFSNYSGYGMFKQVSTRLGMTDLVDGTQIAYTDYSFNETGSLADAPEFTQRAEWWQGKTDDAGTITTSPALFTYSRTSDSSTMTNTIAGPNGITTVMISNNDSASSLFGLLTELRQQEGAVIKSKQEFFYDSPSAAAGSSGLQRNKIISTDDGSPTANQTRVDFTYGQYGRLLRTLEFGFPIAGDFKKRRRTEYTYLDTSSYTARALYHLVTDITVWDAKLTNDNADDVKVSRTGLEYDNTSTGWEMVKYGFTNNCTPPACTPPPGYDTGFVDDTVRGLATKTLSWSDATASSADISFKHQFDVFGNEVKAELGCCSLKRFTFNSGIAGMHYSLPLSVIEGAEAGPNLTNSLQYDFNTSFVNSQADPNNRITSYTPDSAMRVKTISFPKLSTDTNTNPTLETFYADPSYPGKDGLVYQSKLTYQDGAAQKVRVSNQWLDGAGRAVRAGSGAGSNPTSFDAVKNTYDDWGRLRKSTKPYKTTNTNGDTSGLPFPIVYDYDGLHRVITVTLADSNTITTSYNGDVVSTTDPVGRQKESESDGLGRVIRVTEMDSSKQLTQHTTYGYDLNGNLITVNQGGQTRTFKYDSLSRLTYERTPEEDGTITDSPGGPWSAKYTYTSFNALETKKDARGVITTYSYDGLNRVYSVTYNTAATTSQPTPSVAITYGVTAPKLGLVEEVRQIDSFNNNPWKETYQYDDLSRTSSKTVSFDNQAHSYTTSYSYNQISQLSRVTYPSGRFMDQSYDTRGRLSGLTGTRAYINSIGYTPAQQVSSLGLANGVNESYTYSQDRLQLASHSITKGATTLISLNYNYTADQTRNGGTRTGNNGQLMNINAGSQVNGQARDEAYSYDQVGRLATASGWYAQRSYSYDRWGNRTGISGGQTQNVSFQQPGGVTNNRIANVNGGSYLYDQAGDLTSDELHNYSYDAESRIVYVDGGSTAIYGYDAANRRVKKQAGGYTTYYVWEGSHVTAEYSNAPQSGLGGVRYYHTDRLSNRMVTDGTGVVKGASDNLPFGEDAGTSGESDKHRFTSYERDSESGSDYAINRQYSQSTARFNRPDPMSGKIADPQSFNRYAYASNNPISYIDPLGLFAVRECDLISSVSFPIFDSHIRITIDTYFCSIRDIGISREPGGERGGRVKREAKKVAQKMKGPDKELPSCNSFIPGFTPDYCLVVAELIKEYTNSIRDRFAELDPSTPSYKDHTNRITLERNELSNCISKYRDNCGDNQKVPVSFDLNEAEEQASRKFNGPRSIQEFMNRGGDVPMLIGLCTVCPECCAAAAASRFKKLAPAHP